MPFQYPKIMRIAEIPTPTQITGGLYQPVDEFGLAILIFVQISQSM
jgi:hypothetical protein